MKENPTPDKTVSQQPRSCDDHVCTTSINTSRLCGSLTHFTTLGAHKKQCSRDKHAFTVPGCEKMFKTMTMAAYSDSAGQCGKRRAVTSPGNSVTSSSICQSHNIFFPLFFYITDCMLFPTMLLMLFFSFFFFPPFHNVYVKESELDIMTF
ncbi:hypothetical protein E2C01_054660 [Portunus trituberculatus]|uniref:Uncharacterized protein n=1 Tax=Portunus trituberculatus TaxID=210409 RepID=A0A5B7GTT7_PORTR|nr:hypothetical protein [Portunus trituberculatus]